MQNQKDKPTKLQGITRLLQAATIGVTDLVEAMHNRIVHPPFLPSTPAQHLITDVAGIAYNNVRKGTRLVGGGIDKALGRLAGLIGEAQESEHNAALQSALNGVIGDYLETSDNPLAIQMQFRYQGRVIELEPSKIQETYPHISGKLLLMVHGSSKNDLQWARNGFNYGESLALDLGKIPIYLHYNTGRPVAVNGKELSGLLENLFSVWPVPVEEIVVLAHSMGGLVSRSAIYYGQAENKGWIRKMNKVAFLGTPHHGSALERMGNYVDVILESIPYAKPFAKLGKIRSAGVTDLRYGNITHEDQKGDRFDIAGDQRKSVPLPKNIEFFAVAGLIGSSRKAKKSRLLGDNLVSLNSALGKHENPKRNLDFKEENTLIVTETNHSDLLNRKEIYEQLAKWLG